MSRWNFCWIKGWIIHECFNKWNAGAPLQVAFCFLNSSHLFPQFSNDTRWVSQKTRGKNQSMSLCLIKPLTASFPGIKSTLSSSLGEPLFWWSPWPQVLPYASICKEFANMYILRTCVTWWTSLNQHEWLYQLLLQIQFVFKLNHNGGILKNSLTH